MLGILGGDSTDISTELRGKRLDDAGYSRCGWLFCWILALSRCGAYIPHCTFERYTALHMMSIIHSTRCLVWAIEAFFWKDNPIYVQDRKHLIRR